MIRAVNHRWLSLILIILAAASLGLVACQASTETKQGGLGEFCNNRDSDCREGLICDSGECVSANPAATDGCQGVCNKIESCGLTEPNCVFECQDEINDWDAVYESATDEPAFVTPLSVMRAVARTDLSFNETF
jgi:hypothetical protein